MGFEKNLRLLKTKQNKVSMKISFYDPGLQKVLLYLIFIPLFSRAVENVEALYVVFPISLLVFVIINYGSFRLSSFWDLAKSFIPFLIWVSVSNLWSDFPFTSFTRSLYLIFILIGVALLSIKVNSNVLVEVLTEQFYIILAFASVALLFDIPGDGWTGGNAKGFKGVFFHQNTLGMLLFISSAFFVLKLLKSQKTGAPFLKEILPLLLLNGGSIFMLILTFSRASILSYFVFIILFILFSYGFKKVFKLILGITGVLLIIFLLDNTLINYLLFKGDDSVLSSRSTLYLSSIEAAKSGGLVGLGFGVSDQDIKEGAPGKMADGIFIREKGSTILALVEETGLVGLILFYLPVYIILYSIYRKHKTHRHSNSDINSIPPDTLESNNSRDPQQQILLNFLIALLIAMIFHSQFEAWGVGVGSVTLPIYILVQFLLLKIILHSKVKV